MGLFVCHYVTVYDDSGMKPPVSSLLSDTDFITILKSDIFDVHTRKVS